MITTPFSLNTKSSINSKSDMKKKRNRKCPKIMEFLKQEFIKHPTWTKDTCKRVASECGLSESQVYKWGWDQKNKRPDMDDETMKDTEYNMGEINDAP